MKLRSSEWAWEDAEKRNQLLQREMEEFFFFFSTMGRLTVGAKGARAPKYRSGQSLLLLRKFTYLLSAYSRDNQLWKRQMIQLGPPNENYYHKQKSLVKLRIT